MKYLNTITYYVKFVKDVSLQLQNFQLKRFRSPLLWRQEDPGWKFPTWISSHVVGSFYFKTWSGEIMFSNREQFQAFSKMQHDWDDRGELDCLGQKRLEWPKWPTLLDFNTFKTLTTFTNFRTFVALIIKLTSQFFITLSLQRLNFWTLNANVV